jgi:hypothetical protein
MNAHGRIWRHALVAAVLATAVACGSDSGTGVTDPGTTTPPPAAVLLKDIVIDRLPSPFYHFDYDPAGTVTGVSYASELISYDVSYLGTRIKEMQTRALGNRVRLVYLYDEVGRVSAIRYVDATGVTFTVLFYTYDGAQLTGVERDRRVEGGFIIDKTIGLTYYPDGNLQDLTEHRPAIDGVQDETTGVTHFENYDKGLNVDGFGLIHDDFFDHFVLLPAVKLQKNNPGRETRSGDGIHYTVDYTYAYDGAGRPSSKLGALTITNGTDAGQKVQTSSVFSYY